MLCLQDLASKSECEETTLSTLLHALVDMVKYVVFS